MNFHMNKKIYYPKQTLFEIVRVLVKFTIILSYRFVTYFDKVIEVRLLSIHSFFHSTIVFSILPQFLHSKSTFYSYMFVQKLQLFWYITIVFPLQIKVSQFLVIYHVFSPEITVSQFSDQYHIFFPQYYSFFQRKSKFHSTIVLNYGKLLLTVSNFKLVLSCSVVSPLYHDPHTSRDKRYISCVVGAIANSRLTSSEFGRVESHR